VRKVSATILVERDDEHALCSAYRLSPRLITT